MKLPLIIEQDEDGWFVVDCPAIPGCATQGKTRAEALANIREAIDLSLEFWVAAASCSKPHLTLPSPTLDPKSIFENNQPY
jgi:predicted RNase H-like HicB family nuclease